jgi:hypothetical protein
VDRTRAYQFALLYERQHAWESIFDDPRAIFVYVTAEPDRIRYIAPHSRARFFKLSKQKRFLGSPGKQKLNRFQVRAGHGENMRRPIYQCPGKRLAAKVTDVDAFVRADLYGVKTRRLAAHCVNTRRKHLNVLGISDQTAKEPFRDRAAANITCADEEDAFHGSGGANVR